MILTVTIHVRQRGTFTLPARLRTRYGIKEGCRVTILDLDGAILLSPRTQTARRLLEPLKRIRAKGLGIRELGG